MKEMTTNDRKLMALIAALFCGGAFIKTAWLHFHPGESVPLVLYLAAAAFGFVSGLWFGWGVEEKEENR